VNKVAAPMHTTRVKVAVVDQQRMFADALVYRLENESGIQVVCTGDDAGEGAGGLIARRPNVIVLDAEMPQGTAFDIAAEVRRQLAPARILFLMQNADDSLIDQALRLKAEGILSRDVPLALLVQAIRRAAIGEPTFSRTIADRIDFDPLRREFHLREDRPMKELTNRQVEILRHLARGETVKAVALKLSLSPKTVDNLKFRIMGKIGVSDKVALALYAVRQGLIQP
jgi:DNA-binding NarL/FixJ family response regulator